MDYTKPKAQSSSPPTLPPKPPVVAVGTDDLGGETNKADYGCNEALWALYDRYCKSDIHGANSVLLEKEKLLREHVGFPSYKFQLGMTIAMRSDVVFHLGDKQAAASIMADALSVMVDAIFPGMPVTANPKPLSPEFVLNFIRRLDKRSNVKWRQNAVVS
ncbi:MAG TPA: hypothetical protein VGN23_01990 [Verrucomicrobiae bacterium]|jgi:hypothetical protein